MLFFATVWFAPGEALATTRGVGVHPRLAATFVGLPVYDPTPTHSPHPLETMRSQRPGLTKNGQTGGAIIPRFPVSRERLVAPCRAKGTGLLRALLRLPPLAFLSNAPAPPPSSTLPRHPALPA